MRKKKLLTLLGSICLVLVLAALLLPACAAPAPPTPAPPVAPAPAPSKEVPTWLMGTSVEGSSGYGAVIAMARVANKYVDSVEVVSYPTEGSLATIQLHGKGTGEIASCYPSGFDFLRIYGHIAPYDVEWFPYQTFYMLTAEHFWATKADRDDINCWSDLEGKTLYPMNKGTGVYSSFMTALGKLGIADKVTTRDMAPMDAADALALGTIDVVGVYTVGYETTSSWIKNIDSRCDIKVISATPEEAEKMSDIRGFVPTWDVDLSVFSQDVGIDKVWALALVRGQHFSPHCDADLVYDLVKAWHEHADELAELSPALRQVDTMGLDLLTMGIGTVPDVPVHPGAARYLKEKGKWDESWIIGEYKPLPHPK